MKILIANKFFYPRGGGEIYTIELAKLLKEKGHEVAVFSMQHPMNILTEYSDYFASEVDVYKSSLSNIFKILIRPFGSLHVRRKFISLLEAFKPDIVHLNNIHTQLSPILAVIANKRNIPVVWTLHDHKLLCPRYDCIRDHKPCELCFSQKINVIRYRCMKNSFPASAIAYIEALVWNRRVLSNCTEIFLCPSNFLKENMEKGGFDSEKLRVISNFILEEKLSCLPLEKQDFYCYVGRLSTEKGIETLLRAAKDFPQYELRIIGTGPLEQELKSKYNDPHIIYEGYKKWDDLKLILRRAKFLVMPSECYENNPLSIIESLCLGTPVIGARIGGIPELINDGINGFTFPSGDIDSLKELIKLMFDKTSEFDYMKIAKEAREKFDSRSYYRNVSTIYKELTNTADS